MADEISFFSCIFSIDDQVKIFETFLELHFFSAADRSLVEIEIQDYDSDLGGVIRVRDTERVLGTRNLLHTLVAITTELQDAVKKMFLRTPERFHYLFTMRTLKRIFR